MGHQWFSSCRFRWISLWAGFWARNNKLQHEVSIGHFVSSVTVHVLLICFDFEILIELVMKYGMCRTSATYCYLKWYKLKWCWLFKSFYLIDNLDIMLYWSKNVYEFLCASTISANFIRFKPILKLKVSKWISLTT